MRAYSTCDSLVGCQIGTCSYWCIDGIKILYWPLQWCLHTHCSYSVICNDCQSLLLSWSTKL